MRRRHWRAASIWGRFTHADRHQGQHLDERRRHDQRHGDPRNHRPDVDSKTVERLRAAGAILLGKLKQTEGAFIEHHPSVTHSRQSLGRRRLGGRFVEWLGRCDGGWSLLCSTRDRYRRIDPHAVRHERPHRDQPTYARVTRHGRLRQWRDAGSCRRSRPKRGGRRGHARSDRRQRSARSDQRPPAGALLLAGNRAGHRGECASGSIHASAYENVDQLVVEALKASLPILRDAGAEIVRDRLSRHGRDRAGRGMLQSAVEMAAAHEAHYPVRKDDYGPALSGFIEFGRNCSALDYAKAQHRRNAFRGPHGAAVRACRPVRAANTDARRPVDRDVRGDGRRSRRTRTTGAPSPARST